MRFTSMVTNNGTSGQADQVPYEALVDPKTKELRITVYLHGGAPLTAEAVKRLALVIKGVARLAGHCPTAAVVTQVL